MNKLGRIRYNRIVSSPRLRAGSPTGDRPEGLSVPDARPSTTTLARVRVEC